MDLRKEVPWPHLFVVGVSGDDLFKAELDLCEVGGQCQEGGVELLLLLLQLLQLLTLRDVAENKQKNIYNCFIY